MEECPKHLPQLKALHQLATLKEDSKLRLLQESQNKTRKDDFCRILVTPLTF